MDDTLFQAYSQVKRRLGDRDLLTAYKIGLINSTTPFRQSLFLRNIGRMGPESPAEAGKRASGSGNRLGRFYDFYHNEDGDGKNPGAFTTPFKYSEDDGEINRLLKERKVSPSEEVYSAEESEHTFTHRNYSGELGDVGEFDSLFGKKNLIEDRSRSLKVLDGKIRDISVRGCLNRISTSSIKKSWIYKENNGMSLPSEINETSSEGMAFSFIPDYRNGGIVKNTNEFFKDNIINSMVNRFYDNKTYSEYGEEGYSDGNYEQSIIQSAVDPVYGVSKGRNLLSGGIDKSSGYDNPYCRVWTSLQEYSRFSDAIRHRGFRDDWGLIEKLPGYRPGNSMELLKSNSVLTNVGRVRIAPEHAEDGTLSKDSITRCMFSIENLAWKDVQFRSPVLRNKLNEIESDTSISEEDKASAIEYVKEMYSGTGNMLSESQIGPNGGRIMWFPPYNLKFSENVNVEWSSNKFIGRGENIYTYSNTDRSGVLSFTLLIDHPSVINEWNRRGRTQEESSSSMIDSEEESLLKFFAGCYEPNGDNTTEEQEVSAYGSTSGADDDIPEKTMPGGITKKENGKDDISSNVFSFSSIVYFPNDYSGISNKTDDIDYLVYGNGAHTIIPGTSSVLNDEIKWELFTEAMIWQESRGEEDAKGDTDLANPAYGVLQIRQTMINEVNRILELSHKDERYKIEDAFDREKSIKIFNIVQDYRNPSHNFGKAMNLWNTGHTDKNAPLDYVNGVRGKYNRLVKEYKEEGIKVGYGYEMTDNGLSYNVEKQVFGNFYYLVDDDYKNEVMSNDDNYKDNRSFHLNSSINDAMTDDMKTGYGIDSENFICFKELYELVVKKKLPGKEYGILFEALKHPEKYTVSVKTVGYASSHGKVNNNKDLLINRATTVSNWLKGNLGENIKCEPPESGTIIKIPDNGKQDTNSKESKMARFAIVTFSITGDNSQSLMESTDENGIRLSGTDGIATKVSEKRMISKTLSIESDGAPIVYDDEYRYFSELSENDNVLYQKLKEKIRFFTPAFHSITPEGFNARLTFLHQCTRQGPTNSANEGNGNKKVYAGNLAFGRAPFCILRIGDFYNTKVIIDSISIDYGDTQWDMNPEGIGVQPMLANVSMNLRFLGGSNLDGPIEELQNAISFNYFSNTSVYDRRSSRNRKKNNK